MAIDNAERLGVVFDDSGGVGGGKGVFDMMIYA
jgi:hypothetical protein